MRWKMIILICPTCKTNLVEEGKNGKIDCLKCGDEFDFLNGEFCYMSYIQIYQAMLQHHPDKIVKIAKELGVGLDIEKKISNPKNKIEKALQESIRMAEKENEVSAENKIAAGTGRENYLYIMRKIKGVD